MLVVKAVLSSGLQQVDIYRSTMMLSMSFKKARIKGTRFKVKVSFIPSAA